jgi:hypothetical protein
MNEEITQKIAELNRRNEQSPFRSEEWMNNREHLAALLRELIGQHMCPIPSKRLCYTQQPRGTVYSGADAAQANCRSVRLILVQNRHV